MKTYRYTLLKLLILVSMLSSCIREDLADCPPQLPGVQVVFTYDTPLGTRSFDSDELKVAYLYIFDKNGNYIKTIPFTNN